MIVDGGIYSTSIQIGISIDDFYRYSLDELNELARAYTINEKSKIKQQISDNYMLATMISNNILGAFDENNKPMMLWNYYPELFKEERKQHEEEQAILNEQQWIDNAVSSRKAFAMRFNNNENEVIENDTRGSENINRSRDETI